MSKDSQPDDTPAAQEPPPLCSVCIANYNGIGIIDAAIASVRAQDCGFTVEIIVHDDASTDGSAAHIRERHPDVQLIESTGNVGFCTSNNRMAHAARGSFLLLLNNDAELFPDALRILHEAARRTDVPAMLTLPQYDAETGVLIDIGCRFDPFLNPIPRLCVSDGEPAMISGACMWVPRALWFELGGFPDWFESLAEDSFLSTVARLYGYRIEALGSSGFRHWVGKSLGGGKVTAQRLSTTASRRAKSERNKNYVIALTYPAPMLAMILPLHALLLLCEGAVLALIKRDPKLFGAIYLASLTALWARRRQLRQERRAIQLRRRIGIRQFCAAFDKMPYKLSLLLRFGLPEIR